MSHNTRHNALAAAGFVALVTTSVQTSLSGTQDDPRGSLTRDPVVARVYEHLGNGPRPLILVVDSTQFSRPVWDRVKNLVAFRLHRATAGGTTIADAATYLVRDSKIYSKAVTALRAKSTNQEYIWCLLAAVLAHEAAHTSPQTERQALAAEREQLRRCLSAGHLYSGDGWNPLTYLGKVEAKLRNPAEHY